MSEVTQPQPEETPAPAQPSGPKDSYDGLNVWARRNADHGQWQFGVTLDGVDVVLATKKLGGLDDDLKDKFQPGFKKDRADAYLKERFGI